MGNTVHPNAAAVDPSRRFESLAGNYTAQNILNYLGPAGAIALRATGPKGPISKEVEKQEYLTPVYVYHIFTKMTTDEAHENLKILLTNSKFFFTDSIDHFILRSFEKSSIGPFNKNFDNNFPFLVKINNQEKYVLSLEPLENINNPDGTSVVLNYVKTLIFELLYDYEGKIKLFRFKGFLEKDPSSDSHFKKKASSKKKKASPKKKKASPKKKKASQKKKKASPKKKNHGGLS